MAKPLLPESLWERIEPLLPKPRPQPKGGPTFPVLQRWPAVSTKSYISIYA
jgi:hypothetical protein